VEIRSLFTVIFGILCIVISMYDFIFKKRIKKNGERIDAVVVKMKKRQHRRGVTFAPIVSFNANGQKYEVEVYATQYKEKYTPGETISVIYDKRNPEKAILESCATTRFITVIWFFIGVLSLFLFFLTL